MTAIITYQGDLRTEMVHIPSHNTIHTDAPKDNHGKGEAFSPTDLVAAALGSCMLSIMGIYARQHELNIDGTHVEIMKGMSANPRRISKIEAVVKMPQDKIYTAKQQKALEHAALTCPVAKSLHADLVQDIQFVW